MYGHGNDTLVKLDKAAKRYDSELHLAFGCGELIPTAAPVGSTDREQRDNARRGYEAIIEGIIARHEKGENYRRVWDDRHRWRHGISEEQRDVGLTDEYIGSTDREQHDNARHGYEAIVEGIIAHSEKGEDYRVVWNDRFRWRHGLSEEQRDFDGLIAERRHGERLYIASGCG